MQTRNDLGGFTSVNENEDFSFVVCMILWSFLGQVNNEPLLEVMSGHLSDKQQ